MLCTRGVLHISKIVFSEESYLKFAEHNIERIPEDKRWMLQDAERICRDEDGNIDEAKFEDLCVVLEEGGAWENSAYGRPNPEFWNESFVNIAKPSYYRSKEREKEMLKQLTLF